jgi:release factor glutamine methyltransferase
MPREKDFGPGELGPPWTVLKLLRWTAKFFEERDITETPRLDADLLLSHVLDVDRMDLYLKTDEEVPDAARDRFRALVKRRARGEPVAYLVGHREFWETDLKCDRRALVPRPDTEVLVETVIDTLEADGDYRMVDIGTGTGAIALALADAFPDATIAATDISPDALELAAENVQAHHASDRVTVFEGDLLEALPDEWLPLDAVVCNPPYVKEDDPDLQQAVLDHEPAQGLLAGPEGLDVIERLIPESFEALRAGGWLFFEFGYTQAEPVYTLLDEQGFEGIEIHQDYSDRDRVASARKPE